MFDSALIARIFLAAGFSKGLIGLGLPIIAMAPALGTGIALRG